MRKNFFYGFYINTDMITSLNSDINFTSRCKEIETARSACRKLSLFSTTKKQPLISDLYCKNKSAIEFFENYRFDDSYFERRGDKISNALTAYMEYSDKLGGIRKISDKKLGFQSAEDLLNLVQGEHIGNCGEAAESVALILKMNGIGNTYITTLKNGETPINHELCIFNRNSSPFDGTIKNNQTIIVDAWAGIVDFANNALKSITAICNKYFYFNQNENVTINPKNIAKFRLNDEELNKLKKHFPELIL